MTVPPCSSTSLPAATGTRRIASAGPPQRYQDRQVDWPEIRGYFEKIGDARFCFVSVYGFTEQARVEAEAQDVHLLEARDFTRFLLGGKLRDRLRDKLRLPLFGA